MPFTAPAGTSTLPGTPERLISSTTRLAHEHLQLADSFTAALPLGSQGSQSRLQTVSLPQLGAVPAPAQPQDEAAALLGPQGRSVDLLISPHQPGHGSRPHLDRTSAMSASSAGSSAALTAVPTAGMALPELQVRLTWPCLRCCLTGSLTGSLARAVQLPLRTRQDEQVSCL